MNSLSKDVYNAMMNLERLKVKHKIITSRNEMPTHLEKALAELRKQWIEAIVDEGMDEHQRLSQADQKTHHKS